MRRRATCLMLCAAAACADAATSDLEGNMCVEVDSDGDVGACCTALPGRDAMIPHVDASEPEGTITVTVDLAFSCEDFACIAVQGTTAHCTRECSGEAPCPDGFECFAMSSDFGPSSSFCVGRHHECSLCL